MALADDYRYMAHALQIAARGLYTTDPNPRVGCVVAQRDVVVGEGWHEFAGGPHAEVIALMQAGGQARGGTVYVTLEPCSHHGRTPPCVDALIEAGVRRVVAAMMDPNPLVSGAGFARLKAHGIEVESGVLEAQASAINPGFVKRMHTGLPYVRCKVAMSLDGRTAMASGESKWITGPAARADVQHWRARSSAIVTGSGTVLADNPSLLVRLDQPHGQPLRVVVDSRLRTPLHAHICAGGAKTVIVTAGSDEMVYAASADVVSLPGTDGRVDLHALLQYLAKQQYNEVLIEAGPTLSGAFLAADLVDELIIYIAPHLLGSSARGLFHLPALEKLADRIDLDITDMRAVGPDWRILARIQR